MFINSHICILIKLYVQIFPRVRFNYSKIPVCLVSGSEFHNFFHWQSIKTNIHSICLSPSNEVLYLSLVRLEEFLVVQTMLSEPHLKKWSWFYWFGPFCALLSSPHPKAKQVCIHKFDLTPIKISFFLNVFFVFPRIRWDMLFAAGTRNMLCTHTEMVLWAIIKLM